MKFLLKAQTILCALALTIFITACSERTPEQIAADNKKRTELSVRRAQVLLFDNKNADAIAMLEDTHRTCGASPALCEALAYAYAQDKQLATAAMFFENASDLKNGDAELLILAAKTYGQAAAFDAAINAYQKYLKIKPNDMVAWKSLAKCFESAKKYQEALNSYLSAVKFSNRNPNTVEAAAIGLLFVKLGNVTQARQWLEAAYRVSSSSADVETHKQILLGLAAVYLADKETASLDRVIEELDKLDRSIIDKHYPALRSQVADFKAKLAEAQAALRAEELRKAQEAEKAEEERKAAEAKKLEEDKKAAAAKKAEEEKRISEEAAKADLPKVGDAAKVSAESKPAQAETLSEKKSLPDVPDAPFSPTFDDSISDVSDDVHSDILLTPVQKYINKSYKKLSSGDVKGAEREAHKAIFEDRESTQAWRALAKSYEAAGKGNDSYLAAREAYIRNPDDINATLFYLRNASRVLNNEKFLNSLYAAHKKFPNNAEILIGLARTYKIIGDKPNAVFFYKTFVERTSKEHPLYEEVYEEYEELLKNK